MVWCFSDQPKIVRNRFAGVIFGGVCLSILRNKAIRKHAKNYEFDIDFIKKILDCFYVDDFTGGDSDFSKALGLFKKLKLRFLNRHFHLRKWRTKDPELRRIYLENTSNSLQPEKIPGILRFIFLKFVKLTKLLILQKLLFLCKIWRKFPLLEMLCCKLITNKK